MQQNIGGTREGTARDRPTDPIGPFDAEALIAAVPYLVLEDGVITAVGPALSDELGADAASLLGHELLRSGKRLDDCTPEQLMTGAVTCRFRFGPAWSDRPVQLRRLGNYGDTATMIEVRSLAAEMRLESLTAPKRLRTHVGQPGPSNSNGP